MEYSNIIIIAGLKMSFMVNEKSQCKNLKTWSQVSKNTLNKFLFRHQESGKLQVLALQSKNFLA